MQDVILRRDVEPAPRVVADGVLRISVVDPVLALVHASLLADASEPGRSTAFLVLVGFVLSFLFIRMSARMIRAEVSWWPGNLETASGLHLHHLVSGIGLMLVGGFLGFALGGGSPWYQIAALGFGIGCGLTLDEFVLWVHLKDVYWSREGRSSLDAVVLTAAFMALVVIGTEPLGLRVHMTNRLRTEGADHLLAAGRAVGARRFVAQSFAAWGFARTGGAVLTEADRLDPDDPPAALRTGLAATLYLEQAVTRIEWGEGLALRYGGFYGPGTGISLAPDAVMAGPIRKRRFPIVGDGSGVWSHVHIEDAATATALAVERGERGIYNVVDDEPVREWLPALASALGAKPPRRIPRWLGRLEAGEMATVMMTDVRGASNEKAKRELGWQPGYASWRQGFAQGLG